MSQSILMFEPGEGGVWESKLRERLLIPLEHSSIHAELYGRSVLAAMEVLIRDQHRLEPRIADTAWAVASELAECFMFDRDCFPWSAEYPRLLRLQGIDAPYSVSPPEIVPATSRLRYHSGFMGTPGPLDFDPLETLIMKVSEAYVALDQCVSPYRERLTDDGDDALMLRAQLQDWAPDSPSNLSPSEVVKGLLLVATDALPLHLMNIPELARTLGRRAKTAQTKERLEADLPDLLAASSESEGYLTRALRWQRFFSGRDREYDRIADLIGETCDEITKWTSQNAIDYPGSGI